MAVVLVKVVKNVIDKKREISCPFVNCGLHGPKKVFRKLPGPCKLPEKYFLPDNTLSERTHAHKMGETFSCSTFFVLLVF